MMGSRKMTVYLIAAFSGASLLAGAVRMAAAQERSATPVAQQHSHSGSRAPRPRTSCALSGPARGL
jgi:hypothetical protein